MASQRRLQALFDHAPDAILLANDEMRLVDANPSACRLLDYDKEHLLRLSVAEITSPDQRSELSEAWTSFLESGDAQGELRLVRKDGSELEAEFRAVANIVPGVHLSVVRDITDRKRMDAALREAQRSDSVNLLAAGAAHDLNNLLVSIIGQASLLLLEQPQLPERVQTRIHEILQAGQRAGHLARLMLSYLGKAPPQRESINLTETVREMEVLIEASIPKQVHVEYDLQKVPLIEIVPAQVQQVILNLVINAGQAIYESSPGAIYIRTEIRELGDPAGSPETVGLKPGTYVALEVEDTGRGMDEDTRRHIFDPFFTTKVKGKGLGLAAVRRIIRDHRGAIWARSAPNRGCCFTVLLLASTKVATNSGVQEPRENLAGGGRVLVLEGAAAVQKVAAATLEKFGYEVTVLADGRDALSLLASAEGAFSLVLLDLGLRGMAAKDLIFEIRQIRPEVKIIGSSEQSKPDQGSWVELLGLAAFLQKPYTPRQLSEVIQRAVL